MDSILKELYNSGFSLQSDSLSEQKKTQTLNEYLNRHEKDLNALLDETGKEIFQKYRDCSRELKMESDCDNFISGFRLGGRIVIEIIFGKATIELED